MTTRCVPALRLSFLFLRLASRVLHLASLVVEAVVASLLPFPFLTCLCFCDAFHLAQGTVDFHFKAASTELRDMWVDNIMATIRTVVEVAPPNPISPNYGSDPRQRDCIIVTLHDAAKGQQHLLEIYNVLQSARPDKGEQLFAARISDVSRVRLEQYKLPVPKALVILWQALVRKHQGIASEGFVTLFFSYC